MKLSSGNLLKMSNNPWEYCDGIILPSGEYVLATFGHVNEMIKYTGLSSDIIYQMMPINAAPLVWLIHYTKCVVINEDISLYYEITDSQYKSYKSLVLNHIISDNLVKVDRW